MSQRLDTAMRAARAAGQVISEKLNQTRRIKSKGKRDIVTDADFAADRIVRSILHAGFPRDQFLSEEDSKEKRRALWARVDASDDTRLWVVDPLDGTTNYAHHLPCFAVSIALYHAGAVQIGVVYDPLRGEMFSAERGRGAFLNGQPLTVSAKHRFQTAVVGTEWARDQKLRERTAAIFSQMVARATTGRALGSAALSLCYVAAARFDAYFHLSLSPWDVAAAALIVEQAGGRVTTLTGAPWTVHSKAYVVSNGYLHSRMLRFCQRPRRVR
jgi:myo-inositol-1(or 4)-monophosphatase